MSEILPLVSMQEILEHPKSSGSEYGSHQQRLDTNRELGSQSELSRSIIRDLAGFDLWLRRRRGEPPFIVDMYITKPEDPAGIIPLDQDAALQRLRTHVVEIDHDPTQLLLGRELVKANLVSIITYCEEVTRVTKGEPKMPYEQYLMLVDGFRPRMIPFHVLRKNKQELVERIYAAGFPIPADTKPEDIKTALKNYQDKYRVTSRSLVEIFFRRFFQRYRTQLSAILKEDLSPVDFEIVWKERNAFWMMWERVELDGDHLLANWHPRHRNNWDMGTIERYAIHEPAHFIAAYLMRQEIEAGRLDPAVGMFLIPGVSCFKEEGIAQTMDDLAGLNITVDGRLSIASYRLEKRALNNALYLAEDGMPIDEVVEKVREFMPLRSDEGIRQLVEEGTTKPFERAYLPLYGLSDYQVMGLLSRLGEVGMREVYLPQLLRTPMTRDQLMNPTLNLEPRLESLQT